jgi:glutathione S-transferase
MVWVEIVTVAALLQYIAFSWVVGRARVRYSVSAPAIAGHPVFERYFRVHQNTVEQLVVFLPALWLFALRVDPAWAAGLGFIYLAGRLLYFYSYTRDPKNRSLGFAMSALPTLVMLAWVLVAAIGSLRS